MLSLNKILGNFMKLGKSKNLMMLGQIMLVLYSSMLVPKLPMNILGLLDNSAIRLVLISLIIYTSNKNINMAVTLSLALMMSVMFLNKYQSMNNMKSLLNGVIDVPQKVLNKITDDTQELVQQGTSKVSGFTGPLKPVVEGVVDLANDVVDVGQDIVNTGIDSIQDAFLGSNDMEMEQYSPVDMME